MMQRVRNQIGADHAKNQVYQGKGIIIAVLDTGVGVHPDLLGRVFLFRDFVNARMQAYDDCGHGTHVCGILSGSGGLSSGYYRGMATEAKLVVGKVLDEHGEGSTEDMLAGLKWIEQIYSHMPIRILNVSIGIDMLQDEKKEERLKTGLEHLWDLGIAVICAAGNKGPNDNSISAIGASDRLITVGCHDGVFCKHHPRRCENYSGRGKALDRIRKPDVVAPGTDIVSCNRFLRKQSGTYIHPYISKSGTSMSTPIVAGAAARYFEKFPNHTNEEFKQKLTYTATDLGEFWNKQGWGMINVERLLE